MIILCIYWESYVHYSGGSRNFGRGFTKYIGHGSTVYMLGMLCMHPLQ